MSSGTKTSSKTTMLKWCEPARSMIGLIVMPASFVSTRNCVTLERAPLVPAVALRPRHRDPAADTHLFAELAVEAAPGVRAPHRRGVAELPAQELAHLGAQRLGLGRQLAQLEPERLHAHAYDSRLRSSTKRPCVSCGCTQATSGRRPSTRTPAFFRRSTLPGMSWHSKPTR